MALSSETGLLDAESSELEGERLLEYRDISGRSVVGLVAGLASVLAFAHPALWSLPLIGMALNFQALRQLRQVGPAMIGRTAAWIGMACSLLCGGLAPVPGLAHRAALRAEAKAFARQWFVELRQGRADVAYQLTRPAHLRWPLDEALAERYVRDPMQQRRLDSYIREAPVETLLTEGSRAEICYLGNERMDLGVDRRELDDLYSLAFAGDGRNGSQVFRLKLVALRNTMTRAWAWHLTGAELATTTLEGPGTRILAAGDSAAPSEVAAATDSTIARPVVVVRDVDFDFGQARLHTQGMRRAFQVHNAGQAPLQILEADVSCTNCTFVDFPSEPIPPRGTAEVVVRWNVEGSGPAFMQNVTLRTNDPKTPQVHLMIHGDIVPAVQVEPGALVFSSLSPGEPAEAHVRVLANDAADVRLLEHHFIHPQTADFFSLSVSSLAPPQLGARARAGIDLTITVKPGLPLGPLEQELAIKTDIESAGEVRIPIQALVTGDLTVVGRDWRTENQKSWLEIGAVARSRGAKRTLKLLVRGPHRHDLVFGAPHCDVDCVKVLLQPEEMSELNDGSVVQVPLSIDIPPGSPSLSRMGGGEGLCEITIPTSQPAIGRLKLHVRFAIVDAAK